MMRTCSKGGICCATYRVASAVRSASKRETKERYRSDPDRRALSTRRWKQVRKLAAERDGHRCYFEGDDCYGRLEAHHIGGDQVRRRVHGQTGLGASQKTRPGRQP
jgi:hypothetical protein